MTRVAKSPAVLPIGVDLPGLGGNHVRVIVLSADGELLLLLRADRPNVWEPVQGTIGDADAPSPDETPLAAAHRELEEETGLGGASLVWEALYRRCWVVRLPEGADDPVISSEHTAFRWFSREAADAWLARERLYGHVINTAERTPCDYGPPPHRPLPDDEARALHESGHAVLGLLCGLGVHTVSIVPSGEEGGHVQFEGGGDLVGKLVALSAGRAVDFRSGAGPLPSLGDADLIATLVTAVARPGAADDLRKAAMDGARDFLRDPETWAQIEAVARALLESPTRELSGDEVRTVMAAALSSAAGESR